MKKRILDYLRTDRSFEAGMKLYMELGPSMSFKMTLNRQGFTDYNHKLLLEELRKVADIRPDEFTAIMNKPVTKTVAAPVEVLPPSHQEVVAFIGGLPEPVRKSIKLREEFPFLKEKTCPEILKVLVNDMLSAYEEYQLAHERLFTAMTPEDFAAASADVVENYLVNRSIWEELNHYKEKNEILGQHPAFAQKERLEEIKLMSGTDLVKLHKSLENNIARNKKSVADQPDHRETENRLKRIEEYSIELNMVKQVIASK